MTAITITPEMPVGQLVAEDPRRGRLFERLGIDYCCGGRAPLDRACLAKGLDVADVLRQLAAVEAGDDASARQDGHDGFDAASATTADLIDHIVTTHHAYLLRELPHLSDLAGRVVGAHGARHPELREVRDVLDSLSDDLRFHLLKEEKILFPSIERLEAALEMPEIHCVSVLNPIRVMQHEHDDAGSALARLRALTRDYTPPSDACPTYRALLDGLAGLETDMHVHVHEENNILFPRARAAEKTLQGAAVGSA